MIKTKSPVADKQRMSDFPFTLLVGWQERHPVQRNFCNISPTVLS